MKNHKVTYLYGSSTKTTTANKLTPMRALRGKCLDCAGGLSKEVKICCIFDCPLWVYRFGKRPESVADPSLLDPDHVKALADEQSARESTGYQPGDEDADSAEKPVSSVLGGVSARDGVNPGTLPV